MQRERGFTLVEALIALALLAFGLMGIAAMQLTSLQSASTGYQYSAASLAAVDIQESAWGRLATTQNCRRIDLASLRSAWRAQWFEGLNAPLEGSTGDVERTVVDGSCHFAVSIVVNAWPSQEAQEPLDYVFTLPLSEGGVVVYKRQAGFTLVEVMVAMVIGAIIILGAGQLLLTTVTTFTRVETISRQQEAVIFAAEALTRDVRHGAGSRYEISQSLVNDNTCALRRNGQPLIEGLYKGSRDCHAVNLFEQDVQGVAGLYRITLRFADSEQAPFIWHVMQRSQVINPADISL